MHMRWHFSGSVHDDMSSVPMDDGAFPARVRKGLMNSVAEGESVAVDTFPEDSKLAEEKSMVDDSFLVVGTMV